jgi:glycerol uptake facilitator protein
MSDKPTAMQKYLAELVGTFILVWIGPGAGVVAGMMGMGGLSDILAIALAFGIAVAMAIYVFGHVSGAHINPAVTVALAVRGRFPWKDVPAYIIFQLIGAVLASLVFIACAGPPTCTEFGLGATTVNQAAGITIPMGILAEAVGTFFLMITIMGVAVDNRAPKGWAGWIIGMAVAGIIIALAPLTGASINPARTFGPYVGNSLLGGACPWQQFLAVYCLGPVLGASLAAFVYDFIAKPES